MPPRDGDEVWSIERELWEQLRNKRLAGGLRAVMADAKKTVPLPLKHTDVRGQISLYVASVTVTQQYHNPYDTKIEAVYIFPLPQNAAVNDFVMAIGERRIRGIIRERAEAERIYQEAKARGHVASLMTQERPNIFTQSVANIEPGKQIDISITYFNTLRYAEGEYEFVFPMVVGPRFNPPGSTQGVGAAAEGARGLSGQKTEIEYLKPETIGANDIALQVDLFAGMEIASIDSPSHAIEVQRPRTGEARVSLSGERVPNRDFVLRWRVAESRVKSAVAVGEGTFTLLLLPPASLADITAPPREMVFVLDCSGSMSGWPLATAKKALVDALKRLRAQDSFQIVRFSDNASAFGPEPVVATQANVAAGIRHAESLTSEGGTMMIEGIKAALDFPRDPERHRIVWFLTDGYIGNEADILGEVARRVRDSRLYSLGVGSSVNHYLLERMAKLGRGQALFVLHDESTDRVVEAFCKNVEHPAMTDIRIDWGGMGVSDVYPRALPDLFAGSPVVLTGRFAGKGRHAVKITGKVGGREVTLAQPVDLDAPDVRHKAIGAIWARAKIADLEDTMTHVATPQELIEVIRDVALKHGLISDFTAFVAVDSASKTEGEHGVSVKVPAPVPAGVKYETAVGER